MSWTYVQISGHLLRDQVLVATGYSGHGIGHNNPAYEQCIAIGPIPQGGYLLTALKDLEGGPHGPYVIVLTPDPHTDMHGRSGFLIHGDSPSHDASRGCIIVARKTREALWTSGDHRLLVIPRDLSGIIPAGQST